jgi:hypothetical protein
MMSVARLNAKGTMSFWCKLGLGVKDSIDHLKSHSFVSCVTYSVFKYTVWHIDAKDKKTRSLNRRSLDFQREI